MRKTMAMWIVGVVVAISTAAAPASAQQGGARPAPPMPVVLMLLRSAVIAVSHGNGANNYEGLRGLGTHAFQQRHSSAGLSTAFEGLRREAIDLTPVLVTVPELTDAQPMKTDGTLRLVGVFPTRPVEIPFMVVYVEEGGKWRIADINVAARVVPQQQAGAPPAAKKK